MTLDAYPALLTKCRCSSRRRHHPHVSRGLVRPGGAARYVDRGPHPEGQSRFRLYEDDTTQLQLTGDV